MTSISVTSLDKELKYSELRLQLANLSSTKLAKLMREVKQLVEQYQ